MADLKNIVKSIATVSLLSLSFMSFAGVSAKINANSSDFIYQATFVNELGDPVASSSVGVTTYWSADSGNCRQHNLGTRPYEGLVFPPKTSTLDAEALSDSGIKEIDEGNLKCIVMEYDSPLFKKITTTDILVKYVDGHYEAEKAPITETLYVSPSK